MQVSLRDLNRLQPWTQLKFSTEVNEGNEDNEDNEEVFQSRIETFVSFAAFCKNLFQSGEQKEAKITKAFSSARTVFVSFCCLL